MVAEPICFLMLPEGVSIKVSEITDIVRLNDGLVKIYVGSTGTHYYRTSCRYDDILATLGQFSIFAAVPAPPPEELDP